MIFITWPVRLRPAFVDDRVIRIVELFRDRRPHHAADIGRDHDHIRILLFPDIAHQWRRINVVHRALKSLDLIRVQIHRQHAIDADAVDMLATTLAVIGTCCNARAGPGAHKRTRNHRGYPVRRCAFDASIMTSNSIRCRWSGTGRLDDKNILAAYVFTDFDRGFAVTEVVTDARPIGMSRCRTIVRANSGWHCR